MATIKKGKYKHYKGQYYELIDVVRHSEDESELVLYRPLYGDMKLWVRPYDMFFEKIRINNEVVDRFLFVSETV